MRRENLLRDEGHPIFGRLLPQSAQCTDLPVTLGGPLNTDSGLSHVTIFGQWPHAEVNMDIGTRKVAQMVS